MGFGIENNFQKECFAQKFGEKIFLISANNLYELVFEKEGFEKFHTIERFHAPVWFYMPFDLIMEAMPFPIYDTKYRHYVLTPLEEM